MQIKKENLKKREKRNHLAFFDEVGKGYQGKQREVRNLGKENCNGFAPKNK